MAEKINEDLKVLSFFDKPFVEPKLSTYAPDINYVERSRLRKDCEVASIMRNGVFHLVVRVNRKTVYHWNLSGWLGNEIAILLYDKAGDNRIIECLYNFNGVWDIIDMLEKLIDFALISVQVDDCKKHYDHKVIKTTNISC